MTAVVESLQPIAVNQRDAAKVMGVHPRTLRRWEKEKLITPVRVNGGRKMYPVDQLKRLVNGDQ